MLLHESECLRHVHANLFAVLIGLAVFHVRNTVSMGEHCVDAVISVLLVVSCQGVGEIGQSIRIGIVRDANRLLRFYLRDSPFVSGPRSLKD